MTKIRNMSDSVIECGITTLKISPSLHSKGNFKEVTLKPAVGEMEGKTK